MSENIFVTVLMSVYNEEKCIKEAIDSILGQTHQNFEYIIIDDASTDQSVRLIEKYTDSRIRLIKNTENQGLTKNLNKGIELAKGKYILRMDADDVACPNRFALQIEYMENHPEVVLSGGFMKTFGDSYGMYKSALENEMLIINLMFNSVIFHPTFIIRRECMEKHTIRYNDKLRYAQDYNFIYELSKVGKLANMPEVLMLYRIHNGQVSKEKKDEQKKCADFTRNCILNELGIFLSDEELGYWSRFCRLDYHTLEEKEKEKIVDIQKLIIKNNIDKRIYSKELLIKILEQRMKEYIDTCNSVILNRDDNEEKDKYHSLFKMMCQWVGLKQHGKSLLNFFVQEKINRIAIYGLGEVGEALLEELKESDVKVIYAIDKRVHSIFSNIRVVSPEDTFEKVDMIVVTAVTYFDEIAEKIKKKVEYPVVSLKEIINTIENYSN